MTIVVRRLRHFLLVLLPLLALSQQGPKTQLLQCRVISARSPHNAYTDLVRFRDRWFCVFREGRLPYSSDGALRILTSADGEAWLPASLLALPDADLRDPSLGIAPGGHLLLGATATWTATERRPLVWSTVDGRDWSASETLGEHGDSLGRLAWHLGRGYLLAHNPRAPASLRLYTTTDGFRLALHSPSIEVSGGPSESTLLFLPDGSGLCLLSREGASTLLGKSRSPYRAWTWTDLKKTIATPSLIRLPDGRLLAAGRLIDDTVRTSLCWLDPEAEKLTEFFALPSGGDTGSPGLAFYDGLVWVSYYSSHEGRAMIYFAKVRLPSAVEPAAPPRRLSFGK